MLPENLSTFGGAIDRLFYTILGITGFFFLLVQGLLLWFVVGYRRRDGARAHYTHGNAVLEIVWTAIPALILVGLTVASQRVWASVKREPPLHALEVEVLAEQFAWNVRYPGADGLFGTVDDITTVGDLHVPVHTPVVVRLKSKDVVHSFFVPQLRLKQDAVPGLPGRLWFAATQPGQAVITCAELCGFGHYNMRGVITIESLEVFQTWLAAHQGP